MYTTYMYISKNLVCDMEWNTEAKSNSNTILTSSQFYCLHLRLYMLILYVESFSVFVLIIALHIGRLIQCAFHVIQWAHFFVKPFASVQNFRLTTIFIETIWQIVCYDSAGISTNLQRDFHNSLVFYEPVFRV